MVFDIFSREVAELVNERKAPGTHTATFDERGLSSGVYSNRLTAGNFVQARKMILAR